MNNKPVSLYLDSDSVSVFNKKQFGLLSKFVRNCINIANDCPSFVPDVLFRKYDSVTHSFKDLEQCSREIQ